VVESNSGKFEYARAYMEAERCRSDRVNILDLIESGNTGLFRAVEVLRDFHDDRFSTLAQPDIERALAEAVRKSESSGT
jgi:DNA-directed RNA polymerase sigma subunit (sigma70/sigma32)